MFVSRHFLLYPRIWGWEWIFPCLLECYDNIFPGIFLFPEKLCFHIVSSFYSHEERVGMWYSHGNESYCLQLLPISITFFYLFLSLFFLIKENLTSFLSKITNTNQNWFLGIVFLGIVFLGMWFLEMQLQNYTERQTPPDTALFALILHNLKVVFVRVCFLISMPQLKLSDDAS